MQAIRNIDVSRKMKTKENQIAKGIFRSEASCQKKYDIP